MIRVGLCCLAGCLAAKFVFDELKQFQFEKIVFVDPASGQRHVNIKANCGDSVTYVVAQNMTENENRFVRWVEYRVRHPVTGFFIWKLLQLPQTTTYSFTDR